jgi:hypothetical protein
LSLFGYGPESWWFTIGLPFAISIIVVFIADTLWAIHYYSKCHAWQNRLPPFGGIIDLPSRIYRRSMQISRDDAVTHARNWEKANRELKPEEREAFSSKMEIADAIRLIEKYQEPTIDRFERNAYGVTKREYEDALCNRFDELDTWRLMQILCALGFGIEIRVKPVDEESYQRIHFDMRELRRSYGYPHGTYDQRKNED